ncbi:hypothetical protein KY326_03745 [Candidatus Woesearchaeota archaeon]|nr:hypothetical protein [Candidatus Woesearchaeota archaeon]
MEVYYWKNIDWLLFFQYNKFGDKIFFPWSIFKKEWVALPIGYGDEDDAFSELNKDELNPLSPPYYQDWLKKHGVKHTSMSVGDVIKKGEQYLVCMPIGWKELIFSGKDEKIHI